MNERLQFNLEARDCGSKARAGRLITPRGEVLTPVFMPVGTQATVRGARTPLLEDLGASILLANTYHLMLRPGAEVFKTFSGIHPFMKWPRLVLTDSGGFQIFSLPNARRIEEEGAVFRSYIDGREIKLTPEASIGMQRAINSDIMMALDECVPSTAGYDEARRAMELTHRWAERSLKARGESRQALFGIVQGACHEILRSESAEILTSLPFDGYAIGGLAVGETQHERIHFTEYVADMLLEDKPRYLMGVGTPEDLLEAVRSGVDMFDCILPSSMAQQGTAYSNEGKIRLRRGVYKFDQAPLSASCACLTCRSYSRAYLHHLIKSGEGLGWHLIAEHNFYFYLNLMAHFRTDIISGTFENKYKARKESLSAVDVDYPPKAQSTEKKKKPVRSLGDYVVVERDVDGRPLGLIQQLSSKEVMHPLGDPREEAQALYIERSGFLSLLQQNTPGDLCLWDVGLGAGFNAMAALRAAEDIYAAGKATKRLRITSFENDLDSLRLAIASKRLFPHLWHPGPEKLLEHGSYQSENGMITWDLKLGDFHEVAPMTTSPDIVFYDPFSYKTNTAFWTTDGIRFLAKVLEDSRTVLVTYSSSTKFRAMLLAEGFWVARGVSVAAREFTLVLTQRIQNDFPLGDKQLLDKGWLAKWHRSSAAWPEALGADELTHFKAAVESHAQFSLVPK